MFLDIDECFSYIDNCHNNSDCINTDGSFLCTCGNGYSGNGTVCQGKYRRHSFWNKAIGRIYDFDFVFQLI